MTVPNTPAEPGAEQVPDADPYAADLDLREPPRERRPLLPEVKIAAVLTVAGVLLGVVVGLLWLWLAPRVMLVAASDAIRYVDPEGEQRAGADSLFALLGLAAGAVSALAAFLLTRARGGGVAVAAGLTAGGVLGSLLAWQLGVRLGPSTDVVANAKAAGMGVQFSAALQLGAKGALMVWPMTALVVLLILSAAFGKREEDPPPYWAGPEWTGPGEPAVHPEDGNAPAPAESAEQPEENPKPPTGQGPTPPA
ncbi:MULTISPECIES: hypothetical protein [Kitasatospora]|uniref:ABC transporter permease n=1 Tax=Kitasatospora cystarginea TaxID=58350 RepID=A0ABP5Q7L6_9ACTN